VKAPAKTPNWSMNMSHEIEIVNGKAKMAFIGETPWHGLGTRMDEDDAYQWEKVNEKAGLNWDVELQQLSTPHGVRVDKYATVRTSDGKVLGVVGDQYRPLQNRDAFKWFQPFLDQKVASLHTAGSLRGGTRVWVLARIGKEPVDITGGGDYVERFILLSHGHDGGMSIRAGFTPIRVVCANTLASAHSNQAENKLIRIRHTKSAQSNLEAVRDVMNVANSAFEATMDQYKKLASRHICAADVRKFVKLALDLPEEEKEFSTRTLNKLTEICRLAVEGRGQTLPGTEGTLWAAYNGLTEWLAVGNGKNQERRLENLWFGSGAITSAKAFEIALSMAA
jgi:phage/plasmid-like protein (TIGR03299 family)